MSLQKLYPKLPVYLQNIGLSLYGWKLKKERYGSAFREYLDFLMESQYYSSQELQRLQMNSFVELMRHVFRNNPFYKALYNNLGITEQDITSTEALRYLPLTSKETVIEYNEWFRKQKTDSDYLVIHTSGTTGTPLERYLKVEEWNKNFAFVERMRRWAGTRYNEKHASFNGRVVLKPETDTPPFWRYNYASNQLLMSSYHISDDRAHLYLSELNTFQPTFIDGYPSAIYSLVYLLQELGKKPDFRPKAVFVTAETLLEHQKELIENYFACKVFNDYCSDAYVHIHSCEYDSLHVCVEGGIVEILNQNEPCSPGETGELIITGFNRYLQPIVRYSTGDLAVLSGKNCACNRAHPVVEQLIGRVDDILVTPEGRLVGRLDSVFKGVKHIYECQIIQEDTESIVIKLVKDAQLSKSDLDYLLGHLRDRLGPSMKYEVEFVDAIRRGPNGKFRSVISKIKHPINHLK